MKTLLVFPPMANPTYAPLGVATLLGLARARHPGDAIRGLDLNISAWERTAEKVEGGAEALGFFRGETGRFYDEESYAEASRTLGAVERKLASLTGAARRSLEGEGGDPDYSTLFAALLDEMLAEAPDTIGFSFFSLAQLPWILALAKGAKERAGARIIIGGASSTAVDYGELLAAAPFVDGVVLGEGDGALLHILEGGAWETTPGLARMEGGIVLKNRRARPWAVEESPDPAYDDFDLPRYLNPEPVLAVLASRGCKWGKCRFCAHNSTYLGGYRALDGETTAAMLARLKERHGAAHFYFADLYLDAPELGELSEAINARGLAVNFHVLGRPTAEHDAALFAKASKAGLRWISWGVESGSAKLLEAAGKGTSAAEVEKVLAAAKKAGISNLAMMIFGLPTGGEAELEETFCFLERIYPEIDAMTASAFALFTNAPFGVNPEKWGLSTGGRQLELTINGLPVHSKRIDFTERGENGGKSQPRGELEAGRWSRRRRWLGEAPFLEGLPVEHYLLYVSRRATRSGSPPPDRACPRASSDKPPPESTTPPRPRRI